MGSTDCVGHRFFLACWAGAAAATPPPYTPSGDPMYDVMEIMSLWMDALTTTDKQFTNSSTHVVEAIGGFGDRIVYTEGLINDMGVQIGWMADKIVATEGICANLTRACFCDRTSSKSTPLLSPPPTAVGKQHAPTAVPRTLVRFGHGFGAGPGVGGLGPWDAMIDMMLDMLALYNQMSANISASLDYEVDAIGEMGDRIVDTECLILAMGRQIGVMADRIVATESMMANVSRTCCHAPPPSDHPRSLTSMPLSPRSPMPSPPSPDPYPDCKNVTRRPPPRPRPPLRPLLSTPPPPTGDRSREMGEQAADDVWVKMVKELIDPMMAAMSKVMTAMAEGVIDGTNEIGILADEIVVTEHLINDMGLAIGAMADCIVATEALGFSMMQRFCSITPVLSLASPRSPVCPPIPPVHPVNITSPHTYRTLISVQEAVAGDLAAARAALHRLSLHSRESVEGFDPARDFKKMVALCKQFMDMIEVITGSVASETSVVMDAVAGFAKRIVVTIGLINDMAGQINIMAGRIVTTIDLLSRLEAQCTHP